MQRFGPVEPSSGNNAGHSVQSRVGVFCTECPALLPEEGPMGPKHCIIIVMMKLCALKD